MAFDHTKYAPFPPIDKSDRRWPAQRTTAAPRFCAVDLRDGNQALVHPMSVEQKMRFFEVLVGIGLTEIEIGFPSASQIDYDFTRRLIDEDRIPEGVYIQVLTQAREDLIQKTFAALEGAPRAVVHVYNSTNPAQREQVFRMDRDGVRGIAENGARWVRDHAAKYPQTDWIFQYSPESFSTTELDFAVEVVDAVNAIWRPDQGQKVVINLPATVESATPNVFADQVEWFCDHVQYREHFCVSLHTHNDLFRSLLSNCQMALTKADMRTAAEYARLCSDPELAERIYVLVREEHSRTVTEVLRVAQLDRLMDETPLLARSLQRRNPYLDPLNSIQIHLLRESRQFDAEADDDADENPWLSPLLRSINAIAAGMRNTG